jgi:hypothetical protein
MNFAHYCCGSSPVGSGIIWLGQIRNNLSGSEGGAGHDLLIGQLYSFFLFIKKCKKVLFANLEFFQIKLQFLHLDPDPEK